MGAVWQMLEMHAWGDDDSAWASHVMGRRYDGAYRRRRMQVSRRAELLSRGKMQGVE